MPFRRFPSKASARTQDLFVAPQDFPDDFIVAHLDGGARGNPGPAGYGAVIEDAAGHRIAELSDYLGVQTNNFAEYSALLAALEYAVKHGHKAVKAISDSELLVKQMRGEYKVRNESLQQMAHEAHSLIAKLDAFHIKHVLRGNNREADRLANEAMDRGTGRKKEPAARTNSASAQPSAEAPGEVNGLVVNGRVEFIEGSLPEGTMVKIRPGKR